MLSWNIHCKENDGFRVIPVHPVLLTSDFGVHEVGVTVCGVQYVHQLTLLTGGKKFTYACESSRSPHASALN